MTWTLPTFTVGMLLSLSLIMAIGPQNAHIMRMGLLRQHVWLTVLTCVVTDITLIALGVWGLAQLGGLSDKLQGALVGAGVFIVLTYWLKSEDTHPGTSRLNMMICGTVPMAARSARKP